MATTDTTAPTIELADAVAVGAGLAVEPVHHHTGDWLEFTVTDDDGRTASAWLSPQAVADLMAYLTRQTF